MVNENLSEINKENYFAGGQAMALWNKADGKVLRGLVNRRADEIALFNENQIANIITPRCWMCHYTLLLNITLTSCSIM